MARLRWQLLILLGGGLLVALLLTDQGSLQTPAAATPTLQPLTGGTYTEAVIGAPRRINPLLAFGNQPDQDLARLVFSGLIRFDAEGRPLGDLAESWAVNPDGLTYTFSLRPGILWHDQEPVTADDVLFTLDLLKDPGYPGPRDLHEFWKDVQLSRLNDFTVQFRLPEPYAPFLDQLSLGLLPKHLLDGLQAAQLGELDFNLRPIGTGPFRLDQVLTDGARITGAELTPFAGHYGPKPLLSSLRFRYYGTESEALAALRAGEVDGLAQAGAEALDQLLLEADWNLYSSRQPRLTLIILNLGDANLPFFQDQQVRQALLAGLNRQWVVDELLGGQAIVADSPILPGNWAYNSRLPELGYDPAAAAKVLDDAGWNAPEGTAPGDLGYIRSKDGREFSFTVVSADDEVHRAIAEAAQRNWALLGIRTGVKLVPAEELLPGYLQPRAFEAVLTELNLSRFPDPDPYPFWHQTQAESGQNYSQLNERSLSETLELARITTSLEDRAKHYRTFQTRFAGQTPALLLYYPVYNYIVSAEVQGLSLGPLVDPADRFNTIAGWYVVSEPAPTPSSSPTP